MTCQPFLQRLALITGNDALFNIAQKQVYVFGLGGVGSWAAEALVRSGVVNMTIVDSDIICVTNINRQSEASARTIGKPKTEAMKERLLEINPSCSIRAVQKVFCREELDAFELDKADYIIDAIDSLTHKVALIEESVKKNKKLFSSMGMAQKLDPTQIRFASIWETRGCPLARLVRQTLRKDNFTGDFISVYSPERLPLQKSVNVSCGSVGCLCPRRPDSAGKGQDGCAVEWCASKKIINGSAVTVTAAAGMVLGSLVIRDICGIELSNSGSH